MRSTVSYFIVLLTLVAVAACGALDKTMEGRKVNYKAATKLRPLDVPPDLTAAQPDERYTLPEISNRGVATASGVAAQQQATPNVASVPDVLPQTASARIERSGTQRWIVVDKDPEMLWSLLREFWQQSGFVLQVDTPAVGVMETDWQENRAKIPVDGVRSVIGKVFDNLYSSGELDKFRTRLERTPNGTEIYISHRGMVETYTTQTQERMVWQQRSANPDLEAEFLSRLLVKLGAGDQAKAQQQLAAAASAMPKANLVMDERGIKIAVAEPFDRAWRRVGLALDRVGFAVEDRDRSKGIYYVRYIDPELDRGNKKSGKGFFSGLFSKPSTSDQELKAQPKYQILVAVSAQGSEVSVLTQTGQPEQGEVGKRIMALLQEELK
jgi:outer membrane protein assembly factor BamC